MRQKICYYKSAIINGFVSIFVNYAVNNLATGDMSQKHALYGYK